jgi:hypothetical protein
MQLLKKAKVQKRDPKPADSLLKMRKKSDVELTEQELGNASGGLSLNFTKIEYEYQKK